MRIMTNGKPIVPKSVDNVLIPNAYDNSANRITKIIVQIPSNNYTLTLLRNDDYITDAGLVNWGDGRTSNLNDNYIHTYLTAGTYEIMGHFSFGLGYGPTDSMKECLIEVKNLNNRFDNLSNAFSGCVNLIKVDLNNFKNGKLNNASGIFYNCNSLSLVNMIKSDGDAISKIVNELPIKSADDYGVLEVGNNIIPANDYAVANERYWNINDNFIAMYTFNSDTDTLPEFNSEFEYTYVNIDNGDGTTTRGIAPIVENELPTSISFSGRTGLVSLSKLNTSGLTSMANMFFDCENLTSLDLSNFNTSKVTNMENMFYECSSLSSLDVNNFNTSNVTNMGYMFYNCENLTSLDLSNFNTSKVNNMTSMFYNCENLTSLDLSNFNTSKVNNMTSMFYNCENLTSLDLSNFNTSEVTKMSYMFFGCENLTSIEGLSNFNTGKVTDMENMFGGCNSIESLDLSKWNVINLTSMFYMFQNCSVMTTLDLSNWDINSLSVTNKMFSGCNNLTSVTMENSTVVFINKIIAQLPTRTADSYGTVIVSEIGLSIDKTTANSKYWNVFIEIANYVFNSNIDTLPTFNSEYVYSYGDIDNGNNTKTRSIYSDAAPTSVSFNGKLGLLSLSKLNTSGLTSMDYMFSGCDNLTTIDVSKFNVDNVITMTKLFNGCDKLTAINGLGNWNTINVTNMSCMFSDCNNLTSLDLSNFNTSNVTIMDEMFANCENLTSLDLSSFNTIKVTDISAIFYNCTNLTSIDLSGWDTSNADDYGVYIQSAFTNCNNLTSVTMENSDVDSINAIILNLPTRTTDSPGTMNIGSMSGSANIRVGKGWAVKSNTTLNKEIFKFTSNAKNDGCFFNDNLVYVINDIVNSDNTITRTITSNSSPSRISFEDNDNITSLVIDSADCSNLTDIHRMFNCNYITSIKGLDKLNTSKVTDMNHMFAGCLKLTTIEGLNTWNTNEVTNMEGMFYNCNVITSLDLSNFNTSKVNNMSLMFSNCYKLTSLDVSNFNTSEVTDMNNMFSNCYKLTSLDVSNFNTSIVTKMSYMFGYCKALTSLDLSSFNTSKVTLMNNMFYECSNLNLVDMYTSDVDSINDIIEQLPTRTTDSGIMNIGSLSGSTKLRVGNGWVVKSNTTLNKEIFKFTSNFNNRGCMFNSDLVYTINDIVNSDNTITRIITSNSSPSIISFNDNYDITSLVIDSVDCSNLTDMGYMFSGCDELTSLDLSSFDTSKVTKMNRIFSGCLKLTTIEGLNTWNTSKVNDMNHMFAGCKKLTTIEGLNNWNTNEVTNMEGMFYNCNVITSLDLSNFNTSKVNNMYGMFYSCNSLSSLVLSNFNTSNVTNMVYMFFNCKALTSLDLSSFNTSKVTNMDGIFYDCTNLTTLHIMSGSFVDKIATELPTRTSNSPGYLYVTDGSWTSINATARDTLTSKYWQYNPNQ